jgi:hypothetical protein
MGERRILTWALVALKPCVDLTLCLSLQKEKRKSTFPFYFYGIVLDQNFVLRVDRLLPVIPK